MSCCGPPDQPPQTLVALFTVIRFRVHLLRQPLHRLCLLREFRPLGYCFVGSCISNSILGWTEPSRRCSHQGASVSAGSCKRGAVFLPEHQLQRSGRQNVHRDRGRDFESCCNISADRDASGKRPRCRRNNKRGPVASGRWHRSCRSRNSGASIGLHDRDGRVFPSCASFQEVQRILDERAGRAASVENSWAYLSDGGGFKGERMRALCWHGKQTRHAGRHRCRIWAKKLECSYTT